MTTAAPAAASGPAASFSPAAPAHDAPVPGPAAVPARGFHVRLDNFDGPFDLLLRLISGHRMDVTEVALSTVTDEFIAHLRSADAWDLDEATEFLVVAATLLDLKTARLLPQGDVDDEEDLALLEARDLLFARLLAYRAFQQVATLFRELEAGALHRYPRAVGLEQRYLDLLPEVDLGLTPSAFADLAAAVFRPKPAPPTVAVGHMHASPVSVAEQTQQLLRILGERGEVSFDELVADCTRTLEIVARFLGVLNLYRASAVLVDQAEPFGRLLVRKSNENDLPIDLPVEESA